MNEAKTNSSKDERRPSPISLLFAPDRAMQNQAKVGRTLLLLLFTWVCSLLLAAALAVRVDSRSSTLAKLDMSGELKTMSDRQIADETRKAERIFEVVTIAKGATWPPLNLGLQCLVLLGLCWFLRGRVTKRAVAPISAAVILPGAIADLVDAISAFQHSAMPPEGVPLAPRTLTALLQLLGHPLTEPWIKLGNVLDFTSFWSAILMAYGVSAAGQIPRKKALIATMVAWICYRLLTQVAVGS